MSGEAEVNRRRGLAGKSEGPVLAAHLSYTPADHLWTRQVWNPVLRARVHSKFMTAAIWRGIARPTFKRFAVRVPSGGKRVMSRFTQPQSACGISTAARRDAPTVRAAESPPAAGWSGAISAPTGSSYEAFDVIAHETPDARAKRI